MNCERPQMTEVGAVVAAFDDHLGAETALKKLAANGIDVKHLSVIGKKYHFDEEVVGSYAVGGQVKFWGGCGLFWGGLWGFLIGGVFMVVPGIGNVFALGYLTTVLLSVVEGAVVVGGLSALGAALCSAGIPKDSALVYETVLKAGGVLVTVHGPPEETDRAKAILATTNAKRVDLHHDTRVA